MRQSPPTRNRKSPRRSRDISFPTDMAGPEVSTLPGMTAAALSLLLFLVMIVSPGNRRAWAGDLDELCSAAAMGDMARVRAFVKADPRLVRAHNDDGFTPLHFAVMGDQLEIVRFLLLMKAEVNARSNEEWTPLHCAARKAHVEVAKVLLDSGAFVNALDSKGETPLTIAKKNGHKDMIRLLMERRGREKKGNAPE